MLERVDVLVEGVGTIEIRLRRVKTADSAAHSLDLAIGAGVIGTKGCQVRIEKIVVGRHIGVMILRPVLQATRIDAADEVDIGGAVVTAAVLVIGTEIDVVAAHIGHRQVRGTEVHEADPGNRLVDAAAVFVVNGPVGVGWRDGVDADIGWIERRLAVDLTEAQRADQLAVFVSLACGRGQRIRVELLLIAVDAATAAQHGIALCRRYPRPRPRGE